MGPSDLWLDTKPVPQKPLTPQEAYWTNQQNMLWFMMAQNQQITTGLLRVMERQEGHVERNTDVIEKLSDAVVRLVETIEVRTEETDSSPGTAPAPAPFSILKRKEADGA